MPYVQTRGRDSGFPAQRGRAAIGTVFRTQEAALFRETGIALW
jgi:hypothetical protein